MKAAALAHSAQPARASLKVSKAFLQRATLWLFIASSAIVIIEPSPYDVLFPLAVLAFGLRDLLFDRAMIPLILGLAVFNAGGLMAAIPFADDSKSVGFMIISVYLAATAVFFAVLVAKNPLARMATIHSGYIAAGLIASFFGLIGYFNVGGLAEHFTLYGRASGTFKDPNVFGPFLVPPLVWLAQDMMLRRGAGFWRSAVMFLPMLLGLLLSFSRGAWGVWVASTGLMILLTFVTARSPALRRRIVMLSLLGLFAILALLLIALSIPQIREVFEIRASLKQDYDLGEVGRFGAQLRSIPMLLDLPLGFGPFQYRNHFHDQDPHETFVNAFASYGWIGGLAYLAFVAATLYVVARLVFQRTPYQSEAISIGACLVVQIFQGFQIDTDHWRHLFLLYGAMYGLAAASRLYLRKQEAPVVR